MGFLPSRVVCLMRFLLSPVACLMMFPALTCGLLDELQGEFVQQSLVLHGPVDDTLHQPHVILVRRVLRQLICGRKSQDGSQKGEM